MKFVKTFFTIILFTMSACAMSDGNEVINVNQFNVQQLWISYNIFYAIKQDNKIVANLVLRAGQLPLMYELFDPQNKRLSRVNYSYYASHDHFDIYDDNDQLLGATNEYLFQYYPTFYIYQANSSKPIAKAEMNFWGTTFSIYDEQTHKQMAKMSRSFFADSNYWNFKVTNDQLFNTVNMDPQLLRTVVAIQTDPLLYKTYHTSGFKNASARLNSPKMVQVKNSRKQALKRIKTMQQNLGLMDLDINNLNSELLNKMVEELDSGFINTNLNRNAVTEQEKFDAFIQYCLDRVESNDSSNEQKKAIVYLLMSRFQN